MNAYKFNTTIRKGGMIFFPFHNDLLTQEVEVIVVPQNDYSIRNVEESKRARGRFTQLFSKSRGIWQDYEIDSTQLRNDVWGINDKTALLIS
jgi:hypothetical protein